VNQLCLVKEIGTLANSIFTLHKIFLSEKLKLSSYQNSLKQNELFIKKKKSKNRKCKEEGGLSKVHLILPSCTIHT
jgi:hypothetical protein